MSTTGLARAGVRWHRAKEQERRAMAVLRALIVESVADGMTEVDAAKVAGVDRMTVRRALGKL